MWLDALKGIAILAVVFDHAFIVEDYVLWKHSYFHLSWFIFLAGVSNTVSARRRGFVPGRDALAFWRRRLVTLLGPYLWVSALAFLLLRDRPTVGLVLRDLVFFRALPPLYFLVLLFQLLVLFPLLYWALYRAGWAGRVCAVAGVWLVVAMFGRRVTLPWPLGAHYLFGASFLYLFVLGMLATPLLVDRSVRPLWWVCACLPALAWAERQLLRTDGVVMTHPPSTVQMVFSLALLGIALAVARAAPRMLPVRALAVLGRNSLAIFLYHFFFLLPFFTYRHRPWTDHLSLVHGQIVLVLLAVPLSVAGSLAAARLSSQLRGHACRLVPRLWSGVGRQAAHRVRRGLPHRLVDWRRVTASVPARYVAWATARVRHGA